MKSRNFITHSTLSVCLVLVIITLGLTLASCDTGAGRAPAYNITFHQGEGEGRTPDRIPVAQNGYARLPEQGSMTHPAGKKLSGWKAPDDSLIYNPLMEYKVTRDVMFTAQWREASATLYTISFTTGSGGGVAPATIQAVSGNVVSLPTQGNMSPPAGKVFDGWLANGIQYQERAQYRVTSSNVTFTAQWKDAGSSTPNTPSTPTTTYTITYNANGGSGTAPSAQTANSGSNITLPSGSGLTKSGSTFGGWNTNASGTGTNYSAGSSYTVTGNATLYANWVSNNTPTYTVTFNINGGSGTAPSAQTVNAGASITLPSGSGLSRSNYTFGGWNTNSAGTLTNYSAGSSYTVTGNITLYAKWERSPTIPGVTTYTVTFDANGGSGTIPSQTVQAGGSITLPSGSGLSRSGYTFGGWHYNSPTGVAYSAGTIINGINNDVYFYARWVSTAPGVATYTVTFSANGGSGTIPSQIVQSGSIITLPSGANLSRSGYTFAGWSTNTDGSGNTYAAGSSYTVTENTALYAKWVNINIPTYTVTFYANGGSGTAPSAQTVYSGSTITLPSGSGLSKSGSTFGGWSFGSSGTGTNYPAGSSYTVTGNTSFYARWIPSNVTTYTATFNINGGSGTTPSAQTVASGTQIVLPSGSGFSRSGYTFVGWNTNALGSGTSYPGESYYEVTGNVTLYARWYGPPETFTISFSANGGSGTPPSSQTVWPGESITIPSGDGLSRHLLVFGGWNTNASGTGTNYLPGSTFTATGTGSITLYAKWDSMPLLAAPTGVNAFAGVGYITISWNYVPGASFYAVYCGTQPNISSMSATAVYTGNSCKFDLPRGTTYYFMVITYNSAQLPGPASVMVSEKAL